MGEDKEFDVDEDHEEEPEDEAQPLSDQEILESLPGLEEFVDG